MNRNSCNTVLPTQVRKIRPTRNSVSGIYAFRGKVSIPYESTLERDFLIHQEFNRHVTHVIPQPVRLEYRAFNGHTYPYTPDFLVAFDNASPLLVEVKRRAELREIWPKARFKFKAALRHARASGWRFRIQDERAIRNQALANILLLHRYQRTAVAPEERQRVLSLLAHSGGMAAGELLVGLGANAPTGLPNLWHLVAARTLDCDMACPLSPNTKVWVPHD